MLKKPLQLLSLLVIILLVACNPSKTDEPTKTEVTLTLQAGHDTIEQNTEWQDAGVLVKGENIDEIIYTNDTVDSSVIGLTRVTYQYTIQEETLTKDRYIMVTDQSQLSIELVPGVDTVMLGDTWEDAGVMVSSDTNVSVSGTVNTNLAGTYEIIYTITNSAGQNLSVKRIVHVID